VNKRPCPSRPRGKRKGQEQEEQENKLRRRLSGFLPEQQTLLKHQQTILRLAADLDAKAMHCGAVYILRRNLPNATQLNESWKCRNSCMCNGLWECTLVAVPAVPPIKDDVAVVYILQLHAHFLPHSTLLRPQCRLHLRYVGLPL
jgi:hypothetical protein